MRPVAVNVAPAAHGAAGRQTISEKTGSTSTLPSTGTPTASVTVSVKKGSAVSGIAAQPRQRVALGRDVDRPRDQHAVLDVDRDHEPEVGAAHGSIKAPLPHERPVRAQLAHHQIEVVDCALLAARR